VIGDVDPFAGLPDGLPREAVVFAIAAARGSPCRKSKRGAVVFGVDVYPAERVTDVYGAGFNGQPPPWTCNGLCGEKAWPGGPSICSMVCQHAEARAIGDALVEAGRRGERDLGCLDLVHIKVDDLGKACAGGGPSCWQCSGRVVDARLAGVWLLEKLPSPDQVAYDEFVSRLGMMPAWPARWRRYTAEEFHTATLVACKLVAAPPPTGGGE
jgi:hypothetical protein